MFEIIFALFGFGDPAAEIQERLAASFNVEKAAVSDLTVEGVRYETVGYITWVRDYESGFNLEVHGLLEEICRKIPELDAIIVLDKTTVEMAKGDLKAAFEHVGLSGVPATASCVMFRAPIE